MGVADELVAFALGVDHRLITAAHPGRDAQAPHECAYHHDREHGHRNAGLESTGEPPCPVKFVGTWIG